MQARKPIASMKAYENEEHCEARVARHVSYRRQAAYVRIKSWRNREKRAAP